MKKIVSILFIVIITMIYLIDNMELVLLSTTITEKTYIHYPEKLKKVI